jgi:hypothetical protein
MRTRRRRRKEVDIHLTMEEIVLVVFTGNLDDLSLFSREAINAAALDTA